jgi:hypothetical protein
MQDPAAVLAEARRAPARTELGPYMESIKTLRDKKWSWREIADFLKERGVDTDHTKLIRFAQKHEKRWTTPTADAYYGALKQLRKGGKVGAGKWAMLKHLYVAHNRTSTYTELAQAAARGGVKVPPERPHNYANLEFGKLGKLLGQALDMEFLPSSNRDQPFYSSSIGVGSSTTPDGGEFELVMHHELAKALDRLVVEDKDFFKQSDGGSHHV